MTKPEIDLRPRNEVKKIYVADSPGASRKAARVTLTELKRRIKTEGGRGATRKAGLIA